VLIASRADHSRFQRWTSVRGLRRDLRMENTRIVYILRSLADPDRHYTGRTSNVTRRLEWHNAGLNTHTARHRPWQLLVSMEFHDHVAAARFERYLKTGSGRAFAKRHFA